MEVPHQIPKIIHYCWFGKTSLPEDAQRCIASWKKFCPDYEIVEWNETKIDLSALPLYVQQAYAAQKWAFVAGLTIYPADYFCPLALDTGLLKQTENTVAIHWFAGSWWSSEEKYAWKITRRLHRILPVKTAKRLGKAIAIARYRGWSSLAETFSDFCRKQRKHE